mgnify:CR=1 FL=1
MSTERQFTNKQVADTFVTIADLLEIQGENRFKVLAYRRAAETINDLGRSLYAVLEDGTLGDLPGVGDAITSKIAELLTTGQMSFYEKLVAQVPASLAALLSVPDMGPKKVRAVWQQLGVTSVPELKAAAEAGKLRDLAGFGAKSEEKILAGIAALSTRSDRIPLGQALPLAESLLAELRAVPGVVAAEAAGSLRRRRETVGDIDLLVAARDSAPVMAAFTGRPDVSRVLGKGEIKSSVEFINGQRAQLWVHPPERFGTALQYATGSKNHNVRLRELALAQGLSLSDQALTRADGTEILCATEEAVYELLGLPWIMPELREDRGEIQAAQQNRLPQLITAADITASLHNHSTWSDGAASIEVMAREALRRGITVLAITDHSVSLGVANGLSVERLRAQREEIRAVQATLGDQIWLLQGAEIEIKADGTLDYDDEVLAELDIAIASLHTSLRQPREQVTQRVINAIRNPHIDIIGHPTGRLLPDRPAADLDMDAVLAAAAETGTALEINSDPHRLDLNDIYARRAHELSIPLSINTDAHHPDSYDLLPYGIAIARRAWVEPPHVINTWPKEKLRNWLKGG